VVLSVLLLIFSAAGAGAWLWQQFFGQYEESTDNAYVGGYQVLVTPQVAGTVLAVNTDDTQRVERGQLLVQLDSADADVALAQAQAGLADAVRSVRGLYIARAQAQALLAQRHAEVQRADADAQRLYTEIVRAEADLVRRQTLSVDQAVSTEDVEHARQSLLAARSAHTAALAARDAAQAALRQAQEQRSSAEVPIERLDLAHNPRVLQAAARLKEAWLAKARTRILAPVTGYVVRRSVQVGQRLAAGTALLAIVPMESMWVDANFKEGQIGKLRIGQPVSLSADAWDHVRYRGRIAGLGVGTGGTLALLPAQNATGNWIKIVQRVPVRIALEPSELAQYPLRLGLSMRVSVDVHDTGGEVLARSASHQGDQNTPVFDQTLAEADAAIARIIAENR
jgi:membrane fusion protein (multidrug efflux system)